MKKIFIITIILLVPIFSAKANSLGKWVAMVKHKEKNTFYSSDDKKEINTKEKAINNAISKCWFDPNHKPGDWPSENCIVVYAKNTNSTNEQEVNNFLWNAVSNHPKSTNAFTANNLSTKKKAVNVAMKKCYIFVTQKLAKVGYNDCFLSNVYSTNAGQQKILSDKEKKEKQEALNEGNEKWISANKQNYIDQFNKKLNEYKKVINRLDKARIKLKPRIDEHKELTQIASKDIKIVFDNLKNNEDLEIIAIKNDIKNNQKNYLDNSINRDFYKRLQKINLKDFESYPRFKTLKKLINRAEQSKKANDFVGKDGFSFTVSKKLGGNKITLKSDKIGFIKEFKNIENKKLGSGSDEHLNDIIKFNKEVDDQNKLINELIINEIEQLKKLDQEITLLNKNKSFYSNIYKQNILYKSLNLLNVFMQQNK